MSTPMVSNLKLPCDENSDLVDLTLYIQMIESLMYLVNNKPNICYVVNTLSQFMVEPQQSHWKVHRHVLRYLKGTIHYSMRYVGDGELLLHGFVDLCWEMLKNWAAQTQTYTHKLTYKNTNILKPYIVLIYNSLMIQ
jgi:hypothetical protein